MTGKTIGHLVVDNLTLEEAREMYKKLGTKNSARWITKRGLSIIDNNHAIWVLTHRGQNVPKGDIVTLRETEEAKQ